MKKNRKEKKNGKAKKAERHYTRLDSAVTVLRQSGPLMREKWAEKANWLYVRHGGPSNVNESAWSIRHTYSVLRAFNLIEDKDGVIALKK